MRIETLGVQSYNNCLSVMEDVISSALLVGRSLFERLREFQEQEYELAMISIWVRPYQLKVVCEFLDALGPGARAFALALHLPPRA